MSGHIFSDVRRSIDPATRTVAGKPAGTDWANPVERLGGSRVRLENGWRAAQSTGTRLLETK